MRYLSSSALITLCVLSLSLTSCSEDAAVASRSEVFSATPDQNSGSTGVSQPGAQDFGRFRAIIESGSLPTVDTFDSVGFFNEHKFELPDANCGQSICLHAQLGVGGNLMNGNNCTLVLLGLNSPIQIDESKREPLDLAIALDLSGSMTGAPLDNVKRGLRLLADELQPADRVTLVGYSSNAEVLFVSDPISDPDRGGLKEVIQGLIASGNTNIYEGLRLAYQMVSDPYPALTFVDEPVAGEDTAEESAAGEAVSGEAVAGEAAAGEAVAGEENIARQKRVLLLSDGLITSGIDDPARFYALVQEYGRLNVNLGTIGLGTDFDLPLMQTLAELGSGTFYFIDNVTAVDEVFAEEVKSFLVPVAREIRVRLEPAQGYRFRAAYATRLWRNVGGEGEIYLPAAYLAGRLNNNDTGMSGGRRGGGGGIVLEFTPERGVEGIGADHDVAVVNLEYQTPDEEEVRFEQQVTVQNPLTFGEVGEGSYASPSVEKAFIVLNLYAGIKLGLERANLGARGAALSVLVPLRINVQTWYEAQVTPDIDITSDLEILEKLIEIIADGRDLTRFEEAQRSSVSPWPVD